MKSYINDVQFFCSWWISTLEKKNQIVCLDRTGASKISTIIIIIIIISIVLVLVVLRVLFLVLVVIMIIVIIITASFYTFIDRITCILFWLQPGLH